jgi:hypothetical protein
MKRVLISLALLLMTAVASRSQTRLCFDSTAVRIDSMTTQVAMTNGIPGASGIVDVVVWRAASGRIYYSIRPESIRFSGDGEMIDGMSTPRIFDMLAANAVSVGVARGYTFCPVNCGTPASTRVAAAECVQRNGSGVATQFVSCDASGCCYREYTACCSGGQASPTVTLIGRFGSGCPPGTLPPCQSTCQ